MMKRRRGKPLELSPGITSEIVEYLLLGGSRAGAARHVGKNERTLRRWNEKGKKGVGGLDGELWKSVLAAEGYRDRPKTPRSPVTSQIVEATIREEKDGQFTRTEIKLSWDDYNALCQACSDVRSFKGANGINGTSRRPRPGDELSQQQQLWVDHLLDVVELDSLGRKTKTEFRPPQ
jgi:hypothetical protein